MTDRATPGHGSPHPDNPSAGVVHMDRTVEEYQQLLGGPPRTATMRAGLVVLQPAQAVGRHSTGDYEEALVVLEGQGELRLADGTTHLLVHPCLAYCPPATEHDVINTGSAPLRYVYVVAKAGRG